MRLTRNHFVTVLLSLSLATSLSAATQQDTPGTRAYYDTYIEGRYGYTNDAMYRLGNSSRGDDINTEQIKGVIIQKIDSIKLLIGIKLPLHWLWVIDYSYYNGQAEKQVPAILCVDDSGKYTEGETISCWVEKGEQYVCEMPSGVIQKVDTYRTPVRNAISFEQYVNLIKSNVQTPDRIPRIVSCKPISTVIEYKYSITNGQATIIGFNKIYAGALSITNKLGGHPVTGIGQAAFQGCNKLTSVSIPTGVTEIKAQAFAWCTALTSVTIPITVTNIEQLAFFNCTNLPPSVLAMIESKIVPSSPSRYLRQLRRPPVVSGLQ